MRRTAALAVLLVLLLTVAFTLGGGSEAGAATITRYEQNASQLTYAGTWTVGSATAASSGSYRYTNASGMAVTATFKGTSLAWIAKTGPTYGIANVSLDGGAPIAVDLYNSPIVYQQTMWASGFITPGHHVVTLAWTGTKRAAATNTNVALDAMEVRGALAAAPGSYLTFDITRTMAHLHALVADIGVRHGGTPQEQAAVDYAVAHFQALGYSPQVTSVPVIDGSTSHNVIVTKPGSSGLTIVIGAHMDSYGVSPGGNDNGSGSAAVLELARALKGVDLVPTVVLVLFGHEEPMGDGNADHHGASAHAGVSRNPGRPTRTGRRAGDGAPASSP